MAISDTSFFNSYQNQLGLVYSNGVNEQLNSVQTLQNYVRARQHLVQSFSSSELNSGLTIVNSHLACEATYVNATSNIVRSVISSLNSFYNNTYDLALRDMYNGIGVTRLVAWRNSFKEAAYQSLNNELVQQIGYATWNGTSFVFYPPSSSATNIRHTATTSTSTTGQNVILTGFASNITDFALIGDYIAYAPQGILPDALGISTSNTVIGYANTNTIILNNSVSTGAGVSLFAFRAIKNAETLEFRFGTAAHTTGVCTNIFSDVVMRVSLTNNGSAVTTTNVSITTTNATGRALIGVANNSNYKANGISSMIIITGSASAFGTSKALEIWVKGTN